ncbi:hypothetical protein TSAR_010664 [Trichomalopsis sarcophagae]|uniref:Gamma-glutamyltransferase n=1 Tax=Trichomalopsis sarcophagae TaxID=543379 RepID=A0A232FM03_9HYME|nr:hypothetical protein TSAR_010664 [Trichomalopsis sarcophagae]
MSGTKASLRKCRWVIPIISLVLVCAFPTTSNPVPEQDEHICYKELGPNTQVLEKNGDLYVFKPSNETSGTYKKAAVASSSVRCADAGAKILKKGGSAVDAAIATLLCDGVVSLQSMGIGGGFLMTIWDAKEKKAHFLNAREYAPAAAHETIFTIANEDESVNGGKAIAVPGEIAGYWEAHQKFGILKWAELFEDAIKVCEEGSYVSAYNANNIQKAKEDLENLTYNFTKPLKDILMKPNNNNEFVDIGDRIRRQQLAETLRMIRDGGKDVFYNGKIADDLVSDIKQVGGIIEKKDFQDYTVEWKTPVSTTIKGKTLYSASTPGSGAVLAFILNVLEDSISTATNKSVMYQRITETLKWGYAEKNGIGDFIERNEYNNKTSKEECKVEPWYVKDLKNKGYYFVKRNNEIWDRDCLVSVTSKKLLSKEYANEIKTKIEDSKTYNDYKHYGVDSAGSIDEGTSHTSVYAEDGSAVSVTSTVNHGYGSKVLSEKTGIILNNEMNDYNYPGIDSFFGKPSEFNFVRKGSKLRPLSSMLPTVILNEDQTVRLVIGSAGGPKIISGVVEVIIKNLILGDDIRTSVDKQRINPNFWSMSLQIEPGFDPEVKTYLESIGHKTTIWLDILNTVAAIAVNKDSVTASGDFRRQAGTCGF